MLLIVVLYINIIILTHIYIVLKQNITKEKNLKLCNSQWYMIFFYQWTSYDLVPPSSVISHIPICP